MTRIIQNEHGASLALQVPLLQGFDNTCAPLAVRKKVQLRDQITYILRVIINHKYRNLLTRFLGQGVQKVRVNLGRLR
jgi:hypothetical protein